MKPKSLQEEFKELIADISKEIINSTIYKKLNSLKNKLSKLIEEVDTNLKNKISRIEEKITSIGISLNNINTNLEEANNKTDKNKDEYINKLTEIQNAQNKIIVQQKETQKRNTTYFVINLLINIIAISLISVLLYLILSAWATDSYYARNNKTK